jgi:hypothetical protein
MKTSPRILLHLFCTTLIIGISGCESLQAATTIDLSTAAWEYESNSPTEGNLVQRAPGNSGTAEGKIGIRKLIFQLK